MTAHTRDDCDSCRLGSRREFVRDLGTALAVLAGLGVTLADPALAIQRITGARFGDTVKYPIPSADGVQIDKKEEVILVRWKGVIYAFNLSCPHQRTALKWLEGDTRFQCPKHKSKYTPDGTFMSGRATRGMDRFPVTRESNDVVVYVDQMIKQDKDPALWNAAFLKVV